MRKSKLFLFLIYFITASCLSWQDCKAQDAGDASSALYEYGIKLYKEGQVADAIHELKKSLIINPHNLKAKNYLMKIYAERGLAIEPLEAPAKRTKISEYENQIAKLREDVRNYQKQLATLNAQNKAKEDELERLNRQLNLQKELFSTRERDLLLAHEGRQENIAGLKNQIDSLQKEANDFQKQLAALNGQYSAKQAELEKLTRELQAREGRQENIAGLKNQIDSLQKEANDFQKQLAALHSQYSAKQAELEKLTQELNSQKELLERKENELLYAQKEQKKYLAELENKRKELAKVSTDYESRLKKLEADLKRKQAEENILISECEPVFTQGFSDAAEKESPRLESDFDEEFISNEALMLAEEPGVSSWDELNLELQLLMPESGSAFDDEELFYADGKVPEFKDLGIDTTEDPEMKAMLSDLNDLKKP